MPSRQSQAAQDNCVGESRRRDTDVVNSALKADLRTEIRRTRARPARTSPELPVRLKAAGVAAQSGSVAVAYRGARALPSASPRRPSHPDSRARSSTRTLSARCRFPRRGWNPLQGRARPTARRFSAFDRSSVVQRETSTSFREHCDGLPLRTQTADQRGDGRKLMSPRGYRCGRYTNVCLMRPGRRRCFSRTGERPSDRLARRAGRA